MMMTRGFWMALMGSAALVACGGGGGGGDVQAQRSLAQELGPSPFPPASAVITNSQASANSAVAEVIAAYGDVGLAARYSNTPLPTDIELTELPSGRTSEQCPSGGRVTLNAPQRRQVGAQFDIDFANCTLDGLSLDGSMLIEITEYPSDVDFAFAIAGGSLTVRAGGQTFPPFPGLVGCRSSGFVRCYYSLNQRGWANASLVDGDATAEHAVRWESGTVKVSLNGLDMAERTGSATLTGAGGTSAMVLPTLAAGVYDVTISGPGGTGVYSVSR